MPTLQGRWFRAPTFRYTYSKEGIHLRVDDSLNPEAWLDLSFPWGEVEAMNNMRLIKLRLLPPSPHELETKLSMTTNSLVVARRALARLKQVCELIGEENVPDRFLAAWKLALEQAATAEQTCVDNA